MTNLQLEGSAIETRIPKDVCIMVMERWSYKLKKTFDINKIEIYPLVKYIDYFDMASQKKSGMQKIGT